VPQLPATTRKHASVDEVMSWTDVCSFCIARDVGHAPVEVEG
jgi:hypothetical protein